MPLDPFLARLRLLDVCDVSDALDALGLPAAVTGLVATSAQRPIAGRAVTVELAAGPPPSAATRHLCTAAVDFAGPNNVIVVAQHTGIDAAGWGGILSRAAHHAAVAGTIVDGPTRDIEEAAALGYTVYARSCTARTARGRIHEADCQCPIRLGETTVLPGDYVSVDRSGCVVVPAAGIAEVLERAEEIAARSAEMAAAVDKGQPVSRVMGEAYETMLARRNAKPTES